jgi:hypothetical protein
VQILKDYGGYAIVPSSSAASKGCIITFNWVETDENGEISYSNTVCNEPSSFFLYLNVTLFYLLFFYLTKLMLLATQ